MISGTANNSLGLLSFFSFALSVIAAVLAIDMFRLLRTGGFGGSWRVLIIASVIYAFVQALRMAEFFDWNKFNEYGLSQVAELVFALALAYAFFLQRKAFSDTATLRRKERETEEFAESGEQEETLPDARDADWSRLGALYSTQDSTKVKNARDNARDEDSPLPISEPISEVERN